MAITTKEQALAELEKLAKELNGLDEDTSPLLLEIKEFISKSMVNSGEYTFQELWEVAPVGVYKLTNGKSQFSRFIVIDTGSPNKNGLRSRTVLYCEEIGDLDEPYGFLVAADCWITFTFILDKTMKPTLRFIRN